MGTNFSWSHVGYYWLLQFEKLFLVVECDLWSQKKISSSIFVLFSEAQSNGEDLDLNSLSFYRLVGSVQSSELWSPRFVHQTLL